MESLLEGPMDQSFSEAQQFVEQVHGIGSWRGELAPSASLSPEGAWAMTRLVLAQPAIGGGRRPEELLRLFGHTDDDGLQELRGQSVGFLVAGAVALGMTGQPLEDLVPSLIHAAADVDIRSLALRARLVRDYPFGPPVPLLPDWVELLDRFAGRDCYAGVMDAVLELGRWGSSRSTSDASGIDGMSASTVCPGTLLSLYGTAFGKLQPPDTHVYVPTRDGGCREAVVESWSNVQLDVRIPADIGPGCVGFVRVAGAYQEPQRVSGELTACIGAAAEQWTRGFDRVGSMVASCPPCLPGGKNHIDVGGTPHVNAFRFTPEHVEPGGLSILTWNVDYADLVVIAGVAGNGPGLQLPVPMPLVGSIAVGPITGTTPVTGIYRLSASNACGTATAQTQVVMSRTPSLSVTRIEVIQSIQRIDNSVRLVENRRTAVRVFVDSGIADGFDVGIGPNRVSGVSGALLAESLDTGAIVSCGACWTPDGIADPMPSRDVLRDSLNFDVPLSACTGNVRFRATVMIAGALGAPPVTFATGSTDVSFTPKAKQELLPFLITDPSSARPAPTLPDFFASFMGPAHLQPFPEDGFTIHPAIPITLSPVEALTGFLSWQRLVARLCTMVFLFPSTPVGGVRAGMVPADPLYPWGGMGFARMAVTVPSFIAQAGDSLVCAHELGHCFGLWHVNCGGPAGPYDGGLPFTLSDPGLDITLRNLYPTGTNELMTYCFPKWASIEHWDRIFDRIPIS